VARVMIIESSKLFANAPGNNYASWAVLDHMGPSDKDVAAARAKYAASLVRARTAYNNYTAIRDKAKRMRRRELTR
jgi:hypothetical protein